MATAIGGVAPPGSASTWPTRMRCRLRRWFRRTSELCVTPYLRAMIESAEQAAAESGPMTDERETELQAKIAELTESVAKWKKKYEFVSTEAPAAYQTQTAAEQ